MENKKPSNLSLSYYAGYFDGEGTVTITTSGLSGKNINNSGWSYHTLVVMIANTNSEILKELKKYYSGSLLCYQRKNKKHRPCYQWRLCGRLAAKFLNDIYPFVRQKSNQVKIGLEFHSGLKSSQGIKYYKLTNEERKRQTILRTKIQQLNRPLLKNGA